METGLYGNQGALRSAFLLRGGLSKESLIATVILIACIADYTRITVDGSHLAPQQDKARTSPRRPHRCLEIEEEIPLA